MRFYLKLFLCMTFIVTLALTGLGTLLIERDFENAIDQELHSALADMVFTRLSTQIALSQKGQEATIKSLESRSGQIALCTNQGDVLYSTFQFDNMEWRSMLESCLSGDADVARLHKTYGNNSITYSIRSIGTFVFSETTYVLILEKNIHYIFAALEAQLASYRATYMIVLLISACALWFASALLTKPVRTLSEASSRIARGSFDQRAHIASNDEIGQLGQDFNKMAETVQEKINALERAGEQKDRFIASFAHELKTPLTSVIGYADMLYQQPLDAETTHMAAGYILNEGMRLESLSLKLMDLFMLDRQDFVMESICGEEILYDIVETLRPVMADRQIEIAVHAQKGYVRVERDLFKTLLMNLLDNAVKAGAQHISLRGEQKDGKYCFAVDDDGCGMARKELAHIMEAFYMIDKSRSRAQHGMGLGLAICARIADIHHADLTFDSEVGVGTKARVLLDVEV